MTFGFRIALGLYSLGVELFVWTVLVPLTLTRILMGRATMGELNERMGRGVHPRRPRVLIHAVSAGEMNAAEPLVAGLQASAGTVLLSTHTRAGMVSAERIAAAHPGVEGCVFAPWDRRAVKSWLQAIGATAVVVVETEIWPNLFTACSALRLPLFVVNGQVQDKDVRRYRMASGFFRQVLACATWIGTQDERGREAFVAIGAPPARVEVTGNLKLDAHAPPRPLPAAAASSLGGAPVLVAGSTHQPEEALLIECADAMRRAGRVMRVIIAPREVGRAGQIGRLAERRSLTPLRWSALRRAPAGASVSWDVLVVDEYGWLTAFYELADVVFIGGTLAPVGGHNLAEAAARARPVIVGPHVDAVAPLVERLAMGGAVVRLRAGPPVPALVDACTTLLDDPDRARGIGLAARAICREAGGAGAKCLDAIGPRIQWARQKSAAPISAKTAFRR